MVTVSAKLPPGDDVVFRRLFDEENGCRLLISLLNAILGYRGGQRIVKLTLLRSHVAGSLSADKEVILDIRAESADKTVFHIEVQVASHPYYSERMLYYWAEIYAGQLASGEGYAKLRPVVSLHILFFTLLKDPRHDSYHHVFRVRADEDDALLSPQLELHTVEMTKFPDLREGQEGEKWLYWLKHGHEMTEQEVKELGVPEITEAERKLAMISQDRQMRVDYERRKMAHHDAVSQREDFLDEGKRLGLEQGLKQGREQGLKQGLDKGLDEGRHALTKVLVKMLQARGFLLNEEFRARIDAEKDLVKLEGWVERAMLSPSIDAVFNG